MKFGWPRPERIKFLNEIDQVENMMDSFIFQGDYKSFPVYKVPIDLPMYRLENGRTKAAQLEYLSKNPSLHSDFFSADIEREDVQRVQHEKILRLMAKESGLDKHLKKTATRQTQSLILTHDGFIANGNRRLCIMRDLFESDPTKYSHYSHVRIVRLPQCDNRDIVRLEAHLQLEEDYKADYSWTTQAIIMRIAHRDLKMSLTDVGRTYGGLSKKGVEELIDQLEYSETYLSSRGKDFQYSLVNDNKYVFKELVKIRKKFKGDEEKKMIFEQFAFNLIDEVGTDRLFRELQKLYKHFDTVYSQIKEDFPEVVVDENENDELVDDDLSLLMGESNNNIQIDITKLDEEKQSEIRDTIRDTIESQEHLQKEIKKINYVRDKVRSAHQMLQQAATNLNSPMNKIGFRSHLEEIIKLANKIEMWLDEPSED